MRCCLDLVHVSLSCLVPEQVRSYARVFWSRYKELSDWEKVRGRGEVGQGRKEGAWGESPKPCKGCFLKAFGLIDRQTMRGGGGGRKDVWAGPSMRL